MRKISKTMNKIKGVIYIFDLPDLPYGNTMDSINVDIIDERSSQYKISKTYGNKTYSRWIDKERVELINKNTKESKYE